MKKTLLGSTELNVSRLGLGTVKFGRNQQVKYPQPFELPSDEYIKNFLSLAQELGINLIDTAPAYGNSEERLGKLLNNRHEWIISTKVGEEFINDKSHFDFSAQHVKQSIERSLKRLNTDYLDIVLVHSNGDDMKIIEQYNIFETLDQLKKRGLIRTFGMSTKTIEGGLKTIDYADVVMVTYNPIQTEEKPVIDYAYKQKKGVLIKKAFASGHINQIKNDNPIQHSLDFIFNTANVNSVIVGTINSEHLRNNAKALTSSLTKP